MQPFNEFGETTRMTVTGTLSIGGDAAKMAMLGMSVGAGATAPMVQIWEGQTTGSTTILGICTLPLNAFTRIPAYCSGGATFNFLNCANPDITIYWNPVG